MSQFFVDANVAPPPLPPTVPTQFTADDATVAVPAANNLNLFTNDSTANNANGIQTTAAGSTVTTLLTNRLQGTGTTTGTGTADVITFTPTVIGTYSLEYRTAAYNTTSSLGAGYSFFGAIRFDGANSNICDTFDEIVNEEGTMTNVDLAVVVSGANVILRATGYAAQTINWSSVGLYTFVGV
jgi:hypothetical protein